MSSPLTTVEGFIGTIRTIQWGPVLAAPIAASAALVGVRGVAGPDDRMTLTLVGEAGLAFTAVALAFIVDDVALDAAPATPVDARPRLVGRAIVAAPVVLAGWLIVLAMYHSVTPSAAAADVADQALGGLALASAALGLAALGGRVGSVMSPGAAGAGAMACAGVVSRVFPEAWLEALPPGKLLCPAVILFGVLTVAIATSEPAR